MDGANIAQSPRGQVFATRAKRDVFHYLGAMDGLFGSLGDAKRYVFRYGNYHVCIEHDCAQAWRTANRCQTLRFQLFGAPAW